MERTDAVQVKLIYWLAVIVICSFVGIAIAAVINRIFHFFFMATIISSILSGITASLTIRRITKNNSIKSHLNVSTILVSSLLTFSFLATVPINIDRSFSVWMLNQMKQNGAPVSQLEIELTAAQFFSQKNGEISRRIEEQITIGNLSVRNNQISLTKRGEYQVSLNKMIRIVFDLNKKYTA